MDSVQWNTGEKRAILGSSTSQVALDDLLEAIIREGQVTRGLPGVLGAQRDPLVANLMSVGTASGIFVQAERGAKASKLLVKQRRGHLT